MTATYRRSWRWLWVRRWAWHCPACNAAVLPPDPAPLRTLLLRWLPRRPRWLHRKRNARCAHCGGPWACHQHYRKGTDCSCGCPRWRRFRRG